ERCANLRLSNSLTAQVKEVQARFWNLSPQGGDDSPAWSEAERWVRRELPIESASADGNSLGRPRGTRAAQVDTLPRTRVLGCHHTPFGLVASSANHSPELAIHRSHCRINEVTRPLTRHPGDASHSSL